MGNVAEEREKSRDSSQCRAFARGGRECELIEGKKLMMSELTWCCVFGCAQKIVNLISVDSNEQRAHVAESWSKKKERR